MLEVFLEQSSCTLNNNHNDNSAIGDYDFAEENVTFALNLIEEKEALREDVIILGRNFILDTVKKTEPLNSATPRLASVLHTYLTSKNSSSQVAGTRQIKVQLTAISRRHSCLSRGNKLAPSGRPPKRTLDNADVNVQKKRVRGEHVKYKQNLRKNEFKNCANHFKHGKGH